MRTADALKRTFSFPSVRRSLVLALIIGSALNAINQGDRIWHHQPLIMWKLLLTYFVPFAVASYATFAALRDG